MRPSLNEIPRAELLEALDRHPVEVTDTGCHVWLGAALRSGYGIVSIRGFCYRVHRVAWAAEHGPIPDGLHVCHKCDFPRCFGDCHLFLGTNQDNMLDVLNKRRPHGVTKLTPEKVIEIFRNPLSHGEIADKFGISRSNVSLIKEGKIWARVTSRLTANAGDGR